MQTDRDNAKHRLGLASALILVAWGMLFVLRFEWMQPAARIVPWLVLVLSATGTIVAALRRPIRRVDVAVVLAGVLVAIASTTFHGVLRDNDALEKRWREVDTARIERTLVAVAHRVDALQTFSTAIGERVRAFMVDDSVDAESIAARLESFGLLEEIAREANRRNELPQGTQVGIQLLDAERTRVAWAGWPQLPGALDSEFLDSETELLYTRQVSLYRILTHMIPVRDDDGLLLATVLVDMPLEVNYRVNNRFLKSTSLADNIPDDLSADVHLTYFPVTEGLRFTIKGTTGPQSDRPAAAEESDDVVRGSGMPDFVEYMNPIDGNPANGLSGTVRVVSRLGNPLLGIRVLGRPLHYFADQYRGRFRVVTGSLLLVALAIMFVVSLRRFPNRLLGPLGVLKALYLVGFFVFIRYWLLSVQPAFTQDLKLFDPAVFATPLLGGVMRSAGDLLITAVLFVTALYGVLRIARETSPRPTAPENRVGWLFILKGVFTVTVIWGVFELAKAFVGSVVVNANPRLVGETMRLSELQAALLHLSVFLMMSGIFLSGMIVVWGANRLRGLSGTTRGSVLAGALVTAIALTTGRLDLLFIGLMLAVFIAVAPRIVQREDLVSVVIVAFTFVVIVSAATYVFLNEEYQSLRRTFIQEKVTELTNPSDNWKVFILEDVLAKFLTDNTVRDVLGDPTSPHAGRLAFDLWAGSSLSLLGYSSAIHVFNDADSLISRFDVEMPYRVRLSESERMETTGSQQWVVLDLTTETPRGAVRYYRGIVNIMDYVPDDTGTPVRTSTGKVVVDIPFFFESLGWAARTGPQTPELLRNVQEGGIEPRLEEPEALLLARLDGLRVVETSSDVLPVGFAFDEGVMHRAVDLEWPLLRTTGPMYRFFVQAGDAGSNALLAGFPVPDPMQHVLRWSTILSLYFLYTFAIIVLLIILKSFPGLQSVLPTLTPGRRLGFQQKLLGSFLLIALFPAIVLGVFSIGMIKNRFVQESRKEALSKSFSAGKALSNSLVGELDYIVDHSDLRDIVSGRVQHFFSNDPDRRVLVLNEFGSRFVEHDATRSSPGSQDVAREPAMDPSIETIWRSFPAEQMFIHSVGGEPFIGVLSQRMSVVIDGDRRSLSLYYGRRLNEELLGQIADEVGADVNLYAGGELIASSRAGLLSGGFISPMMDAEAFVEVSLMSVDQSLVTEQAGRYRYEVAYLPVADAGHAESGALGLPLLFRPESFHVEVQKATSVVLSIFALLTAATIGLGLILARGIFEPLKGLLEGTRRISRGDFSVRVAGSHRDEIGTVVEAFNEMTSQLAISQAALEERRRYLEVILANIATGVISTDADDRIRAINDAAARILGVNAADVMGRRAGELAGAGHVPEFLGLMSRGMEDVPFVSSEVEVVTEGQNRTIKYMRRQLKTEERFMGTVYVFEDLTELINSKKLAAWVEMARQIAHEIKNPLTPIKLSTQFMIRAHSQNADDFDAIFEEGSQQIIHQVEVLRRIASEFSSFGRLQELKPVAHDVAKQIREIVAPYERNTDGIRVSIDAPSSPLNAVVDPEALRKICTNLIENAMEAMPEGGELQVAAGNAAQAGTDAVWITFTDSGPGLSEEVLGRLFEPYFSTKTTGTGLGLAICRTLSREMGGDVVVRNLGEGGGVEAKVMLQKA